MACSGWEAGVGARRNQSVPSLPGTGAAGTKRASPCPQPFRPHFPLVVWELGRKRQRRAGHCDASISQCCPTRWAQPLPCCPGEKSRMEGEQPARANGPAALLCFPSVQNGQGANALPREVRPCPRWTALGPGWYCAAFLGLALSPLGLLFLFVFVNFFSHFPLPLCSCLSYKESCRGSHPRCSSPGQPAPALWLHWGVPDCSQHCFLTDTELWSVHVRSDILVLTINLAWP